MASSVTNAYTVKAGSIPKVLEAIKKAGVPARFSIDFLNGLGFTSSNDRSLISVFKGLGLIDSNGVPTDVYREYMDRTRAKVLLARQIRVAYAGLFELNTQANNLSSDELKGKLASLTAQTENVVKLMVGTFVALVKEADFTHTDQKMTGETRSNDTENESSVDSPALVAGRPGPSSGLNFTHSLHINLPTSTNVAVYDAIFKALKEHLM